MPFVKANNDLSNLNDFDDAKRFIADSVGNIIAAINGNLEFGPNVRCSIVDFSFPAANTNYRIDHSLNRMPTGYILIKSNVATQIYDGTSDNGTNFVNLRSSAIAVTKILIF